MSFIPLSNLIHSLANNIIGNKAEISIIPIADKTVLNANQSSFRFETDAVILPYLNFEFGSMHV